MVKNYKNKKERDANCTYYDTEHFKYETGHFYLDPSLQTRLLGIKDGESHNMYLFGNVKFPNLNKYPLYAIISLLYIWNEGSPVL